MKYRVYGTKELTIEVEADTPNAAAAVIGEQGFSPIGVEQLPEGYVFAAWKTSGMCEACEKKQFTLILNHPSAKSAIDSQEQTLREIIEDAVWKALERNNWNKQLAADELGISLKSIYNHVKRMNRNA